MERPEYVQIEPVGQCNLRCRLCAIQFRKDGPPNGPLAFMDFTLFTQLVDEMDRMKDLHLQGLGEPFMPPPVLRHDRVCSRERGAGHDQLQPDAAR